MAPENGVGVTLKKTPEMWGQDFGITVMDPDGWRFPQPVGTEPRSFYDPITLEEYTLRTGVSTVMATDGAWERLSVALKTYAKEDGLE